MKKSRNQVHTKNKYKISIGMHSQTRHSTHNGTQDSIWNQVVVVRGPNNSADHAKKKKKKTTQLGTNILNPSGIGLKH